MHSTLRALVVSLLVVLATGCSSGPKIIENEAAIAPMGESGTGAGLSGEDSPSTGEPAGEEGGQGLEIAYFAFDSYTLRREAITAVKKNIQWMNRNSGAYVQIEGHCDERGTTEYNLALGERRAQAVRDYMIKLGIAPDRVSVLSYGEERPEDSGRTEAAYSRNRRAETIVTAQ